MSIPERFGRNETLERVNEIVDWGPIEAVVSALYAAPSGGPGYPPLTMVKILLLRQWWSASDSDIEDALLDRMSFRRFAGLGMDDEPPDRAAIARFRQALTEQGLADPLFAEVNRQLEAHSVRIQRGALQHPTFVEREPE